METQMKCSPGRLSGAVGRNTVTKVPLRKPCRKDPKDIIYCRDVFLVTLW